MPSSIVYRLRSTLAEPPGASAAETERRATYRAALTQFEQLLDAARAAGSAARPLPLYYALAQAGRAIVACRGSEPGNLHGLALSKGTVSGSPLRAVVQPKDTKPGKSQPVNAKPADRGWFRAVAEATKSPPLAGDAPLGALMSSLPELAHPFSRGSWPPARYVGVAIGIEMPGEPSLGPSFAVELQPGHGEAEETAELTGGTYSGLVNRRWGVAGGTVRTLAGRSVLLSQKGNWVGPRAPHPLDDLAPQYRWTDRRWIRPNITDATPPSPLMTWWAVLYALSMLARYHPETWVAALDRHSSAAAVDLERTLDVALDAIPHLVLEAILGEPLLLAPGPGDPPTTL